MKFILLILTSLFLNTSSDVVCTCGITPNEEGAEKLKARMEIIVEGTVLEVVDEHYDEYCSNENVRVKVERVINGPVDLKEIITNQVSAGNCAVGLEIGRKYIFIGSKSSKDKPEIPLVIKNATENGIDLCRKQLENELLYWHCLSKVSTILYTDGCLIIDPNFKFYSYF